MRKQDLVTRGRPSSPMPPTALGDPHGVAAEQLVVLGGAQVAGHAQLHDKVVEDLLGLLLGEDAGLQIPLKVDIQEGGHAAQAHGGAVLLLDGGQIAEVQPLHGLLGVFGRAGRCHSRTSGPSSSCPPGPGSGRAAPPPPGWRGISCTQSAQGDLVGLLLFNQPVHAVQGHPAVVADDAPPAVGVGQAGDKPARGGRP